MTIYVKTQLLHTHRLKNRLFTPNPLLKMMPHRLTHRLTTLSQRARCPLSMLHMWILYDPMRGRPVFIPSWFDRTANGIVVERTGYKRQMSGTCFEACLGFVTGLKRKTKMSWNVTSFIGRTRTCARLRSERTED